MLALALALVAGACGDGGTSAKGPLRYQSLDGSTVDIAPGKPVVVNFFASWCTPCLLEMPDFEKVHQQLGDRVEFIGLNLQEDKARALKVKDSTGVTYTIGLDPKGDLYRRFGAIGMPATAIIDASGAAVDVHTGALTAKALQDRIAQKVGIA